MTMNEAESNEPSNAERAQNAWGTAAPEWVLRLAQACDDEGQTAVSARLDLAQSTISRCLTNTYGAGTDKVAKRVMSTLPAVRKVSKRSNRKIAIENWGAPLPKWVDALVTACDASSQAAAAARLGVSPTTVSLCLQCKPWGRPDPLINRIRGELMGETVECPVIGTISLRECVTEQTRDRSWLNPYHGALLRTCPKCEHNCTARQGEEAPE